MLLISMSADFSNQTPNTRTRVPVAFFGKITEYITTYNFGDNLCLSVNGYCNSYIQERQNQTRNDDKTRCNIFRIVSSFVRCSINGLAHVFVFDERLREMDAFTFTSTSIRSSKRVVKLSPVQDENDQEQKKNLNTAPIEHVQIHYVLIKTSSHIQTHISRYILVIDEGSTRRII